MSALSSDSWPADEDGLRDLDRACDRFEAAWQEAASDPPRLEDFLPPTGHVARSAYFRELFEIELHYRRRNGEIPADDCLEKFPEFAPLIGDLLAAAPGASLDGATIPIAAVFSEGQALRDAQHDENDRGQPSDLRKGR